MILNGLVIMLQGMLVVFIFLALMVWAMKQSSAVIIRYQQRKAVRDTPAATDKPEERQ